LSGPIDSEIASASNPSFMTVIPEVRILIRFEPSNLFQTQGTQAESV